MGFRANLGCDMSFLMFRECISFTKKNLSKLVVCFLDVQKTIDSAVFYKARHSELFSVIKGTRQGGVLSPFCTYVSPHLSLNRLAVERQ